MLYAVAVVASIGIVICLYGSYVAWRLAQNRDYKAMCDVNDKVACSKTFTTPWARVFGILNIHAGLLVYVVMLALAIMDQIRIAWLCSMLLCFASLYFAYILYVKIKSLCLICVSVYLINLLLLVVTTLYIW